MEYILWFNVFKMEESLLSKIGDYKINSYF